MDIVEHRQFEYRCVGREIHRRPAQRDELTPSEAAWLVMNQDHHYVPPIVRAQFNRPTHNLRFD